MYTLRILLVLSALAIIESFYSGITGDSSVFSAIFFMVMFGFIFHHSAYCYEWALCRIEMGEPMYGEDQS